MTVKGDHYWLNGSLPECIETHSDVQKVLFCLLMLPGNPSTLKHLSNLRQSLTNQSELERSKLVEALILFQSGYIEKTVSLLLSINFEYLSAPATSDQDNLTQFYKALYDDLKYVLYEHDRDWVEGQTLMCSLPLHPICLIGDSHIFSSAWSFGENYFVRPCYVPGLQLHTLSTPLPNRCKSSLTTAFQSFNLANHFVISIGEIDFRYFDRRILFSKRRFDPACIVNDHDLDLVSKTEERRILPALKYIDQLRSPFQNVSILSIQCPSSIRLNSLGLDSQQIKNEFKLIDNINASIKFACQDLGLNFIQREPPSDNSWFPDLVHLKHTYHTKWIKQYANQWFN